MDIFICTMSYKNDKWFYIIKANNIMDAKKILEEHLKLEDLSFPLLNEKGIIGRVSRHNVEYTGYYMETELVKVTVNITLFDSFTSSIILLER